MSTTDQPAANGIDAERLYLYKVRVTRYLSSLASGQTSHADLTRRALTNISPTERQRILEDLRAQRMIRESQEVPDFGQGTRPRTLFAITARGRAFYARHKTWCRNGKMRNLIPGAKP